MIYSLPSAQTPLYNHPLPGIEAWLTDKGCRQDSDNLHVWWIEHDSWMAELRLDIEELTVIYAVNGKRDTPVRRTFKYSLSREDIENAIFSGP